MKVYGTSVLKGLLYTLKTFVETYIEDFKRLPGKGEPENGLRSYCEGIVTVQYPEKPMPIGPAYERFRVIPMLVYDQQGQERNIRCTACGICAKVCPPQCIWITQQTDTSGKPIPKPEAFVIDTSICMNCGLCAEFCPFDAIKMDHRFELITTEDRRQSYLYDLEKLLVSAEYYSSTHPQASAAEDEARRLEEEAKRAKEEAKKAAAAKKATVTQNAQTTDIPVVESAQQSTKKALSAEEKAALKEAALGKAAALKTRKAAEKDNLASEPEQAIDSPEKEAL